ncbi:MAG TPA: serine/threonine-protein kinase, partial [Thermoanaerobaculia bacterium]|nr:serine/threonine-protein kinase [Thermoanaerobaculia bacterium]
MKTSRTDPGSWREAKRVLGEALERPPAERTRFIAEACAGDEELRRDVESLAEAAEDSGGILDDPVAAADAAPFRAHDSRAGERIAAYELVRELGEGGMGTVFLARRADDQFRKEVAIKLVRPGMASELVLQRFRSERQILASLEHPHIARLIDGGTTAAGEPYFVLEYVEGEPLIEYCDRRALSTFERVRLFGEVCKAVHYAHQNLVVHRDLKPGNILVTAEGDPKLLDFGIAKLLQPSGDPEAPATGTMFPMMTPDYASPEQIRGERVTTASDVYALGVVLYELLTGRKPYRLTGEPGEWLRVMGERDPEKPSTVAGSRELKGDLDAIVLKAMRKEPEHRYASAEQLSEDLVRWWSGETVRARRGTLAYRASKFARRHRLALGAAALAALAIAGGVFATIREARRARNAEARAERRFEEVRTLANSFLFELHDEIRDLPGSTRARSLLVRHALEYLDRLSRESAGDRTLRRELAEAYLRVGDVQGNPYMANLGDIPGALASYAKAIALLEPVLASGDADDDERSALATAYLVGGGIRLVAGESGEAVAMAEKGLPLRKDLAEREPGSGRRRMDLAQAWQFYAFFLQAAGRTKEAGEALANQATILREQLAATPQDRQARRSLGQNLYLAGEHHRANGAFAEALASYRGATDIQESLRNEEPANTQLRRDLGYSRNGMGNLYLGAGAWKEAGEQFGLALAIFDSIAEADPRSVDGRLGSAIAHHNLGVVESRTGRRAAAIE